MKFDFYLRIQIFPRKYSFGNKIENLCYRDRRRRLSFAN